MHHMFGGPGFWGGPGFFGIPWGSLFLIIAAGVIIYLLVRHTKPAEACSGVCRSEKSAGSAAAYRASTSAASASAPQGAVSADEVASLRREVEGLRQDIASLREALKKD